MDEIIESVDIDVVGIAKDGWVIYGPIKKGKNPSDVELYSACDVDICNGRKDVSDKGTIYSYKSTTFHPYLVGCFGPG